MKQKLVQFTTDYRLIMGYIIAFLLLLTSYLLTLYSNKELMKQTQSVSHTHKVISDVENLLSVVKDGETGLRGFVNTRDTIFLEPFNKSVAGVRSLLKIVQTETQSDEKQQHNLKLLGELVSQKYMNINSSLNMFLQNGYIITDSMMKNGYAGKYIMDSLRLVVSNMQNYENEVLKAKSLKVNSRYTALNTIVITSLVLAFIFAAFGVITFLKENKARQESDKRVIEYQQELKKQIAELDLANKELIEMRREEKFASTGRIARIIAHEVRNPLTNIDLALGQIKEELKAENEDTNFLFDMITRNSNRINQLITELLNATRFTDLNFSRISVNALLDETLEFAHDRIELDNIKLEKKYTTNLKEVSVDTQKIKIAFLNLIINAIEAMKDTKEPILRIITKAENGKCIVEISDNGTGMDAEALSKLFEPYYTTKPKGNGLGLANTHNIILNHKGSIDVESKPGKGTKFICTLDFAQ